MTSRKPKATLKVRAIPVRLSTVRAQVDDEIAGALRLALNRSAKYHGKRLPPAAEEALLTEAQNAIGSVLDAWLDWGES